MFAIKQLRDLQKGTKKNLTDEKILTDNELQRKYSIINANKRLKGKPNKKEKVRKKYKVKIADSLCPF